MNQQAAPSILCFARSVSFISSLRGQREILGFELTHAGSVKELQQAFQGDGSFDYLILHLDGHHLGYQVAINAVFQLARRPTKVVVTSATMSEEEIGDAILGQSSVLVPESSTYVVHTERTLNILLGSEGLEGI